jgi:Glyoxalase-like domain
MAARIAQWTIDAGRDDVAAVASFWASALGFRVDAGDDGAAKLYPPDDASGYLPTVWIQPVDDHKHGKNRAHPDLRPPDDDVDGEVERLVSLGARRVDVGQGPDDPFVVLADPADNEFCVLRNEPRRA